MIESSPQLNHELMAKAVPLMNKPEVRELVDEINEKYLYWSDVKYKRVADGSGDIAPAELWACVKFSRMLQGLTVWKRYGISFLLTNSMQRLCHYFDMNFGGSWGNNSLIPHKSKEQYLI
ncbi:MAG: cell filamentation protein Fic, partial [Bacteroidaceae bacterium]|nr:cell filamentation protein Fic [Bacteroidaceae bacterium]